MTAASRDKIRGCYLLGACGDALGAPLEGLRRLEDILAAHGPDGLRDIIEFKNAYEKGLDYPAGRVTDDTTMAMSTAAALVRACGAAAPEGFSDVLRGYLWQAYINWAVHQDEGEKLQGKSTAAEWNDLARAFWFPCGAGRGTIAALMQPQAGTIDTPLDYDETIRGTRVQGPNRGCGGMMRVAPVALLPDLDAMRIFILACKSGAVTHGAQTAYVATGAVALLVHFAAQDCDMADAIAKTRETLAAAGQDPRFAAGVRKCLAAIDLAVHAAEVQANDFVVIDALPRQLSYKNPFLAVPVLAQTVYALAGGGDVKTALVVAANHSGDSDSVAAIVGNVLGARYGMAAVPAEWGDMLLQRAEILAMADATYDAFMPPAPKPRRAPRP